MKGNICFKGCLLMSYIFIANISLSQSYPNRCNTNGDLFSSLDSLTIDIKKNSSEEVLIFNEGKSIKETSFTYIPSAALTIDLNATVATCLGDPITIVASVNPAGVYTFDWSNNNGSTFTGQGTNTITAIPTMPTTYSITVSDLSGSCTSTNEIMVNIPATTLPGDVSINADPLIFCFGETSTLELTTTNPGNWLFNITAQNWQGSVNFSANVSGTYGTQVVSPNGTTTYTVMSVTDINSGCTYVLPTPVSVTVVFNPSWPTFNVLTLYTLCEGEEINFLDYVTMGAGTSVTFHSESPANASNQISNIYTASSPTTIYALFSYGGCSNQIALTIDIEVVQNPFTLSSATICVDENLDLTTLLSQAVTGQFLGPNVLGYNFTTNVPGTYTIEFNPDDPCYQSSSALIEVIPISTLVLGSATMCSLDPPLNLNSLEDINFTDGVWSGPNVEDDFFNPANLSGNIFVTFAPTALCTPPASTIIEVIPSVIPLIQPAVLCQQSTPFDLNTLVLNGVSGVWSGPEVNNNTINLSNLMGNVSLTFTPLAQCGLVTTVNIEVIVYATPTMSGAEVCNNVSAFDLTSIEASSFAGGTWSGPGVAGTSFDATALSGTVVLSYVSPTMCALPIDITMDVIKLDTPSLANATICEDNGLLDLGGLLDPNYTTGVWTGTGVIGNYFDPLGLMGIVNVTFTSDQACTNPTTTSIKVKDCACATDAGTMSISPTINLVCKDAFYTATHNGDQILDGDNLIFILHDSSGASLGNILDVNTVPTFGFPLGGQLHKVYYISAVAGNPSGTLVDYSDPCLSISVGVPIEFYEINVSLQGMPAICISDSNNLTIHIDGVPPFSVVLSYMQGSRILYDTVSLSSSTTTMTLSPQQYGFVKGIVNVGVIRADDARCSKNTSDSIFSFYVNPLREKLVSTILCKGESVTFNGNIYNEQRPSGTEIIPSNDGLLCDSIINIDIVFKDSLFTKIDTGICDGSSITINGIIYNNNVLSGQSKFTSVHGCDSVVSVNVKVEDFFHKNLNLTLCKGESIVIGDKLFDEINPLGSITKISTNQYCDTIINVSLSFYDSPTHNISRTICKNDFIVVNNVLYDKNNTTGTEIIAHGSINGCDSIVNIALTILPLHYSTYEATICEEDSIVVYDKVFNKNVPSGLVILPHSTTGSCDTSLLVNITFHPHIIDTIIVTLSPTDSITIEGTVFNADYPFGLVKYNTQNKFGCDSASYIQLNFTYPTFNKVDITIENEKCSGSNNGAINIHSIEGCKNYSLTINGQLYDNIVLPMRIGNLAPGAYDLAINSIDGCQYVNTYVIHTSELQADYVLSENFIDAIKGENIRLNLAVNPMPFSIKWMPNTYLSCSDCLDVTFNAPLDSIDYLLLVSDSLGCTHNLNFKLNMRDEMHEIIFPNIIYTNSQYNNAWTVFSTINERITSVKIYDRWGNKVYEDKPDNGDIHWDGRLNGTELSAGVYVYLADITTNNGKVKTSIGTVTILR